MKRVCYAVMLQSQLGPRAGELILQENEQVVSGSFKLLGYRNHFSGRVLQSGKYLISGDLNSNVGPLAYDAVLTVQDGTLSGGIITRQGCWELTGVAARSGGVLAETKR